MAYRLKRGRPVAKELAGIVHKELERAIDGIARPEDPDEAVRDARTRLKKVRAVVHLLRSVLGSDYRRHNTRLRAIGHRLSAPRDAEAAIEIIAAVRKHYPRLVTAAIADDVRRGLAPQARGAESRLQSAPVLRDLRRAAESLPHRVRKVADRSAIRAGLRQGYERARQAMLSVEAMPGDPGFHAWRRRVKDHWYQVRLLEGVRPRTLLRARQLKRLETWLGDDHNLVVLRATLLHTPSAFGDERATAIVLGCIAKYQATLRKRALKLGRRLFGARVLDLTV